VAIKQEVNVPLVLTIGVVAGLVLIVLVIGVQGWYQSAENDEMALKAEEFPNTELIDLKAGQASRISHYRWVDQKNNVVAIPIEAAMKIMIDTQGNLPTTQPAQ
jgi:hypothetical protein